MSRKLQKRRRLDRAISFMLMLVMVVTMLPLFSMPKVYAASEPSVSIKDYTKSGDSYKITDISIENFTYGNISSITISTEDQFDEINVSTSSDINTTNSHYSNGEYYIEFNSKKTATQAENFIKSNVSITPSFTSKNNHTLTIKVTDIYGSSATTVNLANDSTIGATESKPYMVFDENDLKDISDKKFSVLMKDIELTEKSWTAINLNSGCVFDGAGYTITMGGQSTALFNTAAGTIKNVTVNGTVNGSDNARSIVALSLTGSMDRVITTGSLTTTYADGKIGGLAAVASGSGSIYRCENKATISATSSNKDNGVGGIVGYSTIASITYCINTGDITGKADIAGIVGNYASSSGKLENCYNYGTINATDRQYNDSNYDTAVGGITARASISTIRYCYNVGAVSGKYRVVGGIVGAYSGGTKTIANCNNTGRITSGGQGGFYFVGGIVGYADNCNITISNCGSTKSISPTPSANVDSAAPHKGFIAGIAGITGSQNISSCSAADSISINAQATAENDCSVLYTISASARKVGISYIDYAGNNATNNHSVLYASGTNYVDTGSTVTLATTASSEAGKRFIGWADTSDASIATYNPGQTITLSSNLTLYPVFKTRETATNTFSIASKAWFVEKSESNFASEPLNNILSNKSSDGIAKKVLGGNPTSTLKVVLLNDNDKVTLYKLADMPWNSATSSYGDVTWNTKVAEWFENSTYKDTDIATNPLQISDMTSTLQGEFFDRLLSNVNGAIVGMTPSFTQDSTVLGVLGEDGTYYKTFENVPAGIYAVMSEEGYAPVVISILPYKNGPSDSWYLDSEYIAKLKHSAVNVNKWINKNDISDTVAYKDTVRFDIDFNFPSFKTDYADRVTLKGNGTDKSLDYKLYAVDTMSPAFSLINTADNKPYITYSINGGEDTKFPATVDYVEFADETYTGADRVEVTEELISTYPAGTRYTVSKSAPIYEISQADVSVDGVTTLTITFNAHALKEFTKSLNMKEFVMTLHYQATATNKLEIGSDANTNKIVLNYETTPGKPTKIEDEVYGYSFGLQVIKIDGTESTDDATAYLAGAQFKLYKEVTTVPASVTDVYEYNTRKFIPVTNIFTESTSSLDANGVFTSLASEKGITLKGLKEGKYILVETKAPAGYSELAEDIYFEINKLDKAEAESRYGGRYKIFTEMKLPDQETVYNENGFISISVLNFKGLTLPSTGGMGTLLFTIIGIIMMMSVTIILILKRNTKTASDYM